MQPKFRIGDVVLVRGRIEIEYQPVDGNRNKDQRTIKRVPLLESLYYRAAVTGASVRWEGVSTYYGEGRSFRGLKAVPIWLVRPAMRSVERPVFEEDLEILVPVELHNHHNLELYPGPPFFNTRTGELKRPKSLVPWISSSQLYPMTEAERSSLREEMKKWPRDSKGRWLKS